MKVVARFEYSWFVVSVEIKWQAFFCSYYLVLLICLEVSSNSHEYLILAAFFGLQKSYEGTC